jgi:hypothetical protein
MGSGGAPGDWVEGSGAGLGQAADAAAVPSFWLACLRRAEDFRGSGKDGVDFYRVLLGPVMPAVPLGSMAMPRPWH